MKNLSNDSDVVFVICAHSDDQIFGPGGTVAKYAKEGKKVYTIIFSYGIGSHPWIKSEYTIKTRVKEALDVDKLLGGSGVFFLGLDENKFESQFKSRKMYPKLKRLILDKKPSRIFTHSVDDPHPDHRALNKCVIETLDKMKYKCEVYMFDVWTIFNFKKRDYPSIVVDITDTFKLKVKALKMFKSQKASLVSLMWSVYLKAFFNGRKIKTKFAESFYRIR